MLFLKSILSNIVKKRKYLIHSYRINNGHKNTTDTDKFKLSGMKREFVFNFSLNTKTWKRENASGGNRCCRGNKGNAWKSHRPILHSQRKMTIWADSPLETLGASAEWIFYYRWWEEQSNQRGQRARKWKGGGGKWCF